MAVAVAVLLGILIGLCVRPVLDSYLRFKTAELLRDDIVMPLGERNADER